MLEHSQIEIPKLDNIVVGSWISVSIFSSIDKSRAFDATCALQTVSDSHFTQWTWNSRKWKLVSCLLHRLAGNQRSGSTATFDFFWLQTSAVSGLIETSSSCHHRWIKFFYRFCVLRSYVCVVGYQSWQSYKPLETSYALSVRKDETSGSKTRKVHRRASTATSVLQHSRSTKTKGLSKLQRHWD